MNISTKKKLFQVHITEPGVKYGSSEQIYVVAENYSEAEGKANEYFLHKEEQKIVELEKNIFDSDSSLNKKPEKKKMMVTQVHLLSDEIVY